MKKSLITLCGILWILSSCAGLTQVTVPQSNINICGENIVTGPKETYTLKKTYILGIGGMSKKARNTNVVDELFKKVNLQKNEALAYVTQSKNYYTFLFLYTTVKHSASGYVVRVVEGNEPEIAYKREPIAETPTERETKLMQLKEINNILKGDINKSEIMTVEAELKEIEVWYNENKINTNEERKELKYAQSQLASLIEKLRPKETPITNIGKEKPKTKQDTKVKEKHVAIQESQEKKEPIVKEEVKEIAKNERNHSSELLKLYKTIEDTNDINALKRLLRSIEMLVDSGNIQPKEAKPLYDKIYDKINSLE